jgi:endonuclease YncB( thermonuclease family)
MPRAIQSFNGQKSVTVRFGFHGRDPATNEPSIGTVEQLIPDGDTINVSFLLGDDIGVRFLGIDTPEKTLPVPGGDPKDFVSLTDDAWVGFLDDPFSSGSPFTHSLTNHILGKVTGGGAAQNHRRHGDRAEDALEGFVTADVNEYLQAGLIRDQKEFRFFMRFAFEVMEGFGRLLCFVNRDQPNGNVPSARPLDYNTRMIQSGLAAPYFIWPNINPFRAQGSIIDAIFAPGAANDVAESDSKLREARQMVRQARQAGIGIYNPADPLRLQAFEVRFLSRQRPPDRWVIDLSKQDDILVHPQSYHTIPNAEDRLFINPEHVPLFAEAGWVRQEAPL